MYWFIEEKPRTETRENVYIIAMVSREPRQIMGFDAAFDKSPVRIQQIVDDAQPASRYCTDGWSGYVDVIYPGEHIRTRRTHQEYARQERHVHSRGSKRRSSSLHTGVSEEEPLLLSQSRHAGRLTQTVCGRLQQIWAG